MKILKVLTVCVCGFVVTVAQGVFPIVDDGNSLLVDGSIDVTPADVIVGQTQSGNTMVIDDGYRLGAGNLYIGLSNSANNAVQFDATSSGVFSNVVVVGVEGAYNSTTVLDGASVAAATVVAGAFESSSNNVLTVYGGTVTADYLTIGNEGDTNRMDVSNGGEVGSSEAWVGAAVDAAGNEVLVSGTDSSWINTGALTIGTNGNSGNFVTVTNGGHISVDSLEILGTGNGFELDRDGQLTVLSDFDASVTNFHFNEGAALYVGGELTGMTNAIVGARTLGITGNWDQTGLDIAVGDSSSINTLNLEDGGDVTAANLFVGTSSNAAENAISISGVGSTLALSGTVEIGSAASSNNTVDVFLGGKLTLGSGPIINSNNTLNVWENGHLVVNDNFDASMAGFDFGAGGILETTGTLTGMSNSVEGARSIRLNGGTWNTGGDLTVGDNTAGNSIYITAGGALTSGAATLGAGAASDGNQVFVEGAGSTWSVGGAITVGDAGSFNMVFATNGAQVTSSGLVVGASGNNNEVYVGAGATWDSGDVTLGGTGSDNRIFVESGGQLNSDSVVIGGSGAGNKAWVSGAGSVWKTTGDLTISGAGKTLRVAEDGGVDVGQQLVVQNGAFLSFESGGVVSNASYYQDGSSVLQFDSMTNVAVDLGSPLVTSAGTAELDAGATFEFTGSISNVSVGVVYSKYLIDSTSLIVEGVTNATGVELDSLIGVSSNNLLDVGFMSQNDDLYMQILRQSLTDAAGFVPGSQMADISGEIDMLSTNGSQAAVNQLGLLGQVDGATKNTQLTQLYEKSAPTYMHMEGMLEGMRQVKRNGVMPDSMWPIGAAGPHLYGEQVRGWVKGYGSWATQDGTSSFSSYDQNIFGVVVGFDKAYGDLLAGLAGGYTSSDISQQDGDSSDSSTAYGMLYSSWGSSAWFADASLAFGMGSVKNKTGTMFDSSAEFDANQLAFYLGGGKEMLYMDDRLILTPSAGIQGGLYMQDGYTEKATTAVVRKVDDYDRFSFRSEFGVQAIFHKELGKVVLMPETHANWLHEFNADEDHVGYSLVGGTGSYSFGMQAPVADVFEVGVGLSLWANSKSDVVYEWSIGFDSRFGDGYSASALSARLVAEF